MSRAKDENLLHAGRMKLVRKTLGNVSQAYLAKELEVPLYKIKAIEAARIKISPELALRMEQKFHLNFKWLLTGEGPMFLSEAEPERSLSPELAEALKNPRLRKILLLLKDLPEEEIEEVYRDLKKAKRRREEKERLLREIEELKKLIKSV